MSNTKQVFITRGAAVSVRALVSFHYTGSASSPSDTEGRRALTSTLNLPQEGFKDPRGVQSTGPF